MSTRTQTTTNTTTDTTTVTATDVREVFRNINQEVVYLAHCANVPRDSSLEEALVDASILALNDVIEAIKLEFYLSGELVRGYVYRICTGSVSPSGGGWNAAPRGGLDNLPKGTRVRLVATRNPQIQRELWDSWMKRIGWVTATPLTVPEDVKWQSYGTFASGGYGVNREMAVNPRFDRPVAGSETDMSGKVR